jgi:XTP/dITP diphosphohydrolase
MKKVVLATKNQGKVRELREVLAHLPIELLSLADFPAMAEPVEDGKTFEDNARIKARYYMQKTHCACIADDSGLEVALLGGAPGVHSARFAGVHGDDEANNRKLVAELRARGQESSPADYRCVLLFVDTDGHEIVADGRCDGEVRTAPRGTNGFGYDPYFYRGAQSMAELILAAKQQISHRVAALRDFIPALEDYLK